MTSDIIVQISSGHASVERYIPITWTLDQLKARIETITGIPPAGQSLTVTEPTGGASRSLANSQPTDTVESLKIQPKSHISVTDTRPKEEQLDFDGEVEKYEMPLSEYEKRTDSVLAWKKQNQLGRFQDSSSQVAEQPVEQSVTEDCNYEIGQQCWVKLASGTVQASIAYVGAVDGIPSGTWVGVRLKNPVGKNDGSVKGKKYFDAEPNHGAFVRTSAILPDDDDLDEL